nr:hypothetical protein [Tanacetum cinerariifolium]
MQAKLEEEERIARQKEEEANIALIESWDNTQAMMDEDYELAARLKEKERRELTIEEKLRLFVELINKRKKYFARLRAEKIRSKPPTKTQKRNQMCTYLKNMVVEGRSQAKGSKKRTRKELDEVSVKRQKLEDDAEKVELKLCLEIVPKDDEAINIEYLATKYPIVEWETHILDEKKIQYVLDLYMLIKEIFKTTNPEEKKYPLTQEMLSRMISRRLEVDHECEMAYEHLRFTRTHLKK